MGTIDIIMVVFLAIVLVGGMGSLYYFNKKEED